MENTNQPGVYLRGGVGLPTVAPRSTSKVRQSVEKTSNSSSSPIGVAFNQNINKSSPDKDNFRFKRQISGSSNDMAVSVEDEFSRKDSFRFPSGGNITNASNRNLSQARFSNSHRKSRTKTEQVSVQVSATGRMNYPTRANPNGGKRRLNNNKSGRNSNTSSNSSIGNNDQQQLYDYSSTSIVNTNNMNNNNFNQGNYYNNNNNNTNNDDTNNNSNSGNMYNNRNNNNNNNNNMRRPHKNHGYAKEKSRRRRRHSSNSDRPHGNNKNHIRGKVASTSKHNSMDSMHESRMKAIFKKKNQNGNYKTPRKDDNNNNNNNIGNGMYYGNNSNSKEKINISPSSTERIINEHGQIRITNTPSPPPSANPNSDRKRPSRRPGSNLINNNHPSSSKSKSKIKVPDTMKNMTIETRKVIHDEYYSKNINNNKTSLVSIHKGGSSNSSSSSSSGKHSSGRKRNKRNSSGNNKFTSGSPPVINDKNKNAQSKGYGLTYKERHSPTKRGNQRRDNNTPNKGGLQNPRLSNIHNNDKSRKKTFSPSAPNRPRNTNGGSGHKSRPRHQKRHSQRRQMQQQQQQQMEDQEYGAGNDNVDEDNNDDDDYDDEVIQPRENPNLRLQSIDDIQSTNNINKSPRNNVKNSKRKIGTPPGAAIFQFPLWNNNKKTTAISISNPKEDGLRQGSSTTASTNSTSNVMTPPSLVKGSIHEDKDAVEWKNPSPPDSKKQTPSKRTSFFSSFFKKTDKDSDSPPSTKKETKRPSSSSAATTLINIDEKSMSKNILTTKTINSPRNKKSNANGDGRIVPRLQRNENSKSAPGLQDSLNSNEGLESFNTSNNNTNVVITNSKKKKKKKEKTISPPVVSGEVIHEFGLWKNVKKNVDKADKALDSYKKNMDNDGTTTSKKSSKKDKNRSKNSSSIVGKKLPTPPKKPSSSGKRFRGRNGRKSPSTSPVEKAKVKESTSSYSNDNNNITNSNISTGQLSIDVGLNANEDDESSIMENIVVNTTNDSSAMNSNSNFSQSPRIAKTGAVLFRQSLSPTPFQ